MTLPHRKSGHCPGCGARGVPPTRFACRSCWYRLPRDLRREITSNYRRNPMVHLQAIRDAIRWFLDNPPPRAEGQQP